MSAPFLLDLSHTSHTRARTGIQRVTRALNAALEPNTLAITHDPFRSQWRPLESWEQQNLSAESASSHRGARWPWTAMLRGRALKLMRRSQTELPANAGLIVPEIFSPTVASALPELFAATSGPRVALFHDAIALKFPELTPKKSVARFPAYLLELLAFDGIAAVSDDSHRTLVDYWRWLGKTEAPQVVTIPLGVETQSRRRVGENSPLPAEPVILSVGSIEGRKNHLALLEACEALWATGRNFSLRLIGLAHPQTGAAARAKIESLRASGRAISYDGPVSDASVEAAYSACSFTVYPSLMEGFGLPVLESLAYGKPCVCSAAGALGEAARGGGCITLPSTDSAQLRLAIERLITCPEDLASLSAAARSRPIKTWHEYVAELESWMHDLRKRRA